MASDPKPSERAIRAVIFDLGGVVLDSPLPIIRAYAEELGLEKRFFGHLIMQSGSGGAWARLERGELTVEEFCDRFDEEAADLGAAIDSRVLMQRINGSMRIRPEMVAHVRTLRRRGYAVAALTNNWKSSGGVSERIESLRSEFDVFVESAREGMRKPDPRIYQRVLRELSVTPEQAVFLDDIGHNLKPARALGMTTIRVDDPTVALAELERALYGPGRPPR